MRNRFTVLQASIKLWGGLDLLFVSWVTYSAIKNARTPFVDEFLDLLAVSESFGAFGVGYISILGFFVSLSAYVSGVLMLWPHRIGVFISLFQAPFRLLLIVPPTFFFLANVRNYFEISMWSFVAAIAVTELVKVATQIGWLKFIRNRTQ